MNKQGRFIQLAKCKPGDVFFLSASPAEVKHWRVVRHEAGGRTRVERLHEDRTYRMQTPSSQLMVFVPVVEEDEELMTPEELDALEAEVMAASEDALDHPDTISIDPLLDEGLI